jgi:type II secretory pathway pseudopilin PulG
VEIMIVIVIIAVLAAVAVPVYTKNIQKAKRSEAESALGSIRRQVEIYRGEFGNYPKQRPADYVIGKAWNDIKPGELNGKYFSDSSYTYDGHPNGKEFKIICDKGNVMEFDLTLDHTGTFQDE